MDLRTLSDEALEGLNIQLTAERQKILARQRELGEEMSRRAELERHAQAVAELPGDLRRHLVDKADQEVLVRSEKWASFRTEPDGPGQEPRRRLFGRR